MKLSKVKSPIFLKFIFQVIRPFYGYVGGQFFIAMIGAISLPLRPYCLKHVVNNIFEAKESYDFTALKMFIVIYMLLELANIISSQLYIWMWLRLGPALKKKIRLLFMGRLVDHSWGFFHKHLPGELANKINDITNGIPTLLRILIDQFFCHTVALFLAAVTVFQVDTKMGIALVIWSIFFLSIATKCSFITRKLSYTAAEARSTIIGHITDIFSNILSVRLFRGKTSEKDHLTSIIKKSIHSDQQRDWFSIKASTIQGLSFLLFHGLCLWWLISGLRQNLITPGDVVLIFTLNIAIIDCLGGLARDFYSFAEEIGVTTLALDLFHLPLEIQDQKKAQKLIISKGEIHWENVSFGYTSETFLFNRTSIHLNGRERIGLVGYSGSGKSTFVHLILRLFDIKSGRILIDNQDIRTVTQDSLYESIAFIPQEPCLFYRSILENIRYGHREASDEEVIKAAKKAQIHEFIENLPQGYKTVMGNRGVQLSGGQRQRIAIARAILKDAPILVLDEATSHLDSITESSLQLCLDTLMQNRTTLIIAHRLSTLLSTDRILVFNQGKIVEDGTHYELLQQRGLYKKMWDAQIGGFLPQTLNSVPAS